MYALGKCWHCACHRKESNCVSGLAVADKPWPKPLRLAIFVIAAERRKRRPTSEVRPGSKAVGNVDENSQLLTIV